MAGSEMCRSMEFRWTIGKTIFSAEKIASCCACLAEAAMATGVGDLRRNATRIGQWVTHDKCAQLPGLKAGRSC